MMQFIADLRGVDPARSLIYLWEVFDKQNRIHYWYVGQSKSASRPLKRYKRNVERLLDGEPYLGGANGYRDVHYFLAEAVRAGRSIKLSFICNDAEDINAAERKWQRIYEGEYGPQKSAAGIREMFTIA